MRELLSKHHTLRSSTEIHKLFLYLKAIKKGEMKGKGKIPQQVLRLKPVVSMKHHCARKKTIKVNVFKLKAK